MDSLTSFINQSKAEVYKIIKDLCSIPAPTHFEQGRAEYCKNWLIGIGAEGVYIDRANNVVLSINCEGSADITVFAAHTDTVFPDTEPMPYFDDGERIHSPGVADDTASVAVLLLAAKYFVENKISPDGGVMFVCNSCEEGLGNLKGTRRLFEDFANRIGRFITFDASLGVINDACVGSHRYELTVKTEGGHSFANFGRANAIAKLSEIVTEIYKITVPEKAGTHTTYNVGTISGGTSVNTIAQEAKILCEYRSDDKECLEFMEKRFAEIFAQARADGVDIDVSLVGERPCADIDKSAVDTLALKAAEVIEGVMGEKVRFTPSSTDCNIPLSLGVPAICVGANIHEGVHTREEWVDKASVLTGLEIAIKLAVSLCGE